MSNSTTGTTYTSPWILFIVLLITPISGMGIDIFVPSLPAITEYFAVDSALVQLSVSLYLLGFGLGQVPAGFYSDAKGRKAILITGLGLFVLLTFLVPFAPNVETFLLLRVLQGLLMAIPGAITKAILIDCYEGKTLRVNANYMTIVWSLGPILAPALGGYLQEYLGWEWNFYFLGGFTTFAALLALGFLPETLPQKKALAFGRLQQDLKLIVFNAGFLSLVTVSALMYGLMTLFNVLGPFMVQEVLGFSAVHFGHTALMMGVAWSLGNVVSRFLISRYNNEDILSCALPLMTVGALLMVGLSWFYMNWWVLTFCTMLMLFGGGMIFPNSFSKCMSLFPERGGVAGALMSSLFCLGAGLASTIGTQLRAHTLLPLALAYLGFTLLANGVFFRGVPTGTS